jgi:tRNA dimethylallyltransferase
MTRLLPVVAILGPTAVGKTEVALALAERVSGEIISADSRLLYRGMDIGTAKPTQEQRARVPHHLIDVADPREIWSLGRFRQGALAAIQEIHGRGNLPFLVGGTGQYLTALLEGWSPPPLPGSAGLRSELEAEAAKHGAQALHERLRQVDPRAAATIDPRNVRRVVRALEVFELTGQPASRQRSRRRPPFESLWIGLRLPRPELYARIDARLEAMLQAGLVDEVRRLLGGGLPPSQPSLSAIGYRQIVEHLEGSLGLDEAVARIRRATRQLVRRQANWFKASDPRIRWFDSRPGVEDEIEVALRAWLRPLGWPAPSQGQKAQQPPRQG